MWLHAGVGLETDLGREAVLEVSNSAAHPLVCLSFSHVVPPQRLVLLTQKYPPNIIIPIQSGGKKEEELLQGHNASKHTSTQCKRLNKPAFDLPLSRQHSCASRTKWLIQLDGRHSHSSSFTSSCPQMRNKVIFISPKPSSF